MGNITPEPVITERSKISRSKANLFIDLGPEGYSGIEAYIWIRPKGLFVYIDGSNHQDDFLHHLNPFASIVEHKESKIITNKILELKNFDTYYIGGASHGGAIASAISNNLAERNKNVELYLWGPKKPPMFTRLNYNNLKLRVVRHINDWIPKAGPFRNGYPNEIITGNPEDTFFYAHVYSYLDEIDNFCEGKLPE